jgi:hypothetical protein
VGRISAERAYCDLPLASHVEAISSLLHPNTHLGDSQPEHAEFPAGMCPSMRDAKVPRSHDAVVRAIPKLVGLGMSLVCTHVCNSELLRYPNSH